MSFPYPYHVAIPRLSLAQEDPPWSDQICTSPSENDKMDRETWNEERGTPLVHDLATADVIGLPGDVSGPI